MAALGGRRARRKSGLILVEGPQAVRELLQFKGEHVSDVYFSQDAWDAYPDLVELAQSATRWVHLTDAAVSRAISTDSQGIAAVAAGGAILSSGSLDDFLAALEGYVAYLPQTQDPGNEGTIIRSADAFGAAGAVLGEGSVDPTNPKVIRASAGSVFHMPIYWVQQDTAVKAFTDQGLRLVAASAEGADSITAPKAVQNLLSGPHAWVIGNEAWGLPDNVLSADPAFVRIPMTGKAESLNAAAAATVCLFASQVAHSERERK